MDSPVRDNVWNTCGIAQSAERGSVAPCRAIKLRGAAGGQGCPDQWRSARTGHGPAFDVPPAAAAQVLFKSIPVLFKLAGGEHGLSDLGRDEPCAGQFVAAGAVSLRCGQ